MSRNEAQTRFELIDPAIELRGWLRPDILVETTAAQIDIVDGKARRRPAGRTDYILRRPLTENTEPIPLAILEAKREGLPPEHGLQQGKDYRVGELNNVPFVFSSNGHQFVEYDEATGQTTEAKPISEFPRPGDLLARYLSQRRLPSQPLELKLLETGYAKGRGYLRYYQDAAIRAALEKIIRDREAGKPPRVLLSLATGSGKTRVAAALLRRMLDAGAFGKALFVCDRTELRDNGLGDFQAIFGTDAAEVDTRHPQKNARVLIGTYQTLDHKFERGKSPKNKIENFFQRHYPPGFFDVIVIDECHRSAWGDWFDFLRANKKGIHIGMTATPRQIRLPKTDDEETKAVIENDARRLADNLHYFGEPVYEYPYLQGVRDGYLAPAEIETWDLFHDGRSQPERVRGVLRSDLAGKKLTNALTGQPVMLDAVAERNDGAALEQKLILPERVEAMCQHLFNRLLFHGENSPHQKTIVFCASDHHADLVANQLNNLYAAWCKAKSQRRLPNYAFKCMASVGGQSLIPDFRGRQRAYFIATTMDLLTTGVNVPCVRNIAFFRYIRSPILFHQIVGRGTRVDEATGKLMFRIFDYTGATALFGADFVTPPPGGSGEGGDGPPCPPPPPPVKAKGVQIDLAHAGNFYVMNRNGQTVRVTPEEYRQRLIDELLATVPTLANFRERWIDPEQRRELMEQLAAQGLVPENLRANEHMDDYDLFDVIAAVAYRVKPKTRAERAARLDGASGPDWLIRLPQPAANVIRAIARQFERAGTDALESQELWNSGEVHAARGLTALKQGGEPNALLRKTKELIFAA
ncbi:MAG TPA: DEAD/DEAH box helicase family protein [Verrucomicrobiae bacterium]|nr:DEAD/DEAH box helicase family protein [Verrucomicrobiae bacterium]